jgi:hypothetical protein
MRQKIELQFRYWTGARFLVWFYSSNNLLECVKTILAP